MSMIRDWIYRSKLDNLLIRLKASGFSPKNLEICPLDNWYISSVYDRVGSPIISESVSGGFSDSAPLSLLKAVVENIERKAFEAGQKSGYASCRTDRSDGFAAYPVYLGLNRHAESAARENAYLEAVERFLWARWWDDRSIGQRVSDITSDIGALTGDLHAILRKYVEVDRILQIEPHVASSKRESAVILAVQLQGGGIITGGAAFRRGSAGRKSAVVRSLGELIRHGIAYNRMREGGIPAQTFYQRRMIFFGSGAGDEIVKDRLSQTSGNAVDLPELLIDEPIPHEFADHVKVHRCLFKDQPPFIGGALERLCI